MKERIFRPAFLLRLIAFSVLVLPLTPLFDGAPFLEPEFVLVLDVSPSMEERLPDFGEEVLQAWRGFDGGRWPVVSAGRHPSAPAVRRAEGDRFTDLPSALRAAGALFSPRAEKRILLASDGISRTEEMSAVLESLKGRSIKVFALSPPAPVRRAGAIEIVLPVRAYLWEPFTVKGVIAASSTGPVTAVLRRNGEVVAEKSVEVGGTGLAEVSFTQEADRVGTVFYSLHLTGHGYPPVAGSVRIAKAPRVRYITDDLATSQGLIELYRAAGIEVLPTAIPDLPYLSGEIEDDVIVLDDLPSPALSENLVEKIRKAVGVKGKGLLVIGGRKGLGTEDYRGTPFESILPVTAGYKSPLEPAPVSLVIALDTSFSMFFRGRGKPAFYSVEPRKIDVAKESAKEVVRVLRDGDRLGIIGNSTDLFWIQDLGEIEDREGVITKVDRIFPEGDGIYFYSIVRESSRALLDEPSTTKHILVFGDADDIDQYEVAGEGHAFDLVREMSQEGVSLSVMAIGSPADKDVPFLRTVSLLGKGDFYLVSNLRALPSYFVTEYRKLVSRHFLEEDVWPMVGDFSPLMHGVSKSLPRLSGIAMVTPRKGSEVPMGTDTGIPLVIVGRYGKGNTAVFASDNGYRWASRWLGWSSAKRFWLQLLLSVAPDSGLRAAAFSSLEADPDRDRIVFRYREGRKTFPSWDRLWLHRRAGEEGAGPVELVRKGLAEYRSGGPLPATGLYRYHLTTDKEGGDLLAETTIFVPPPAERLPFEENWALVEQVVTATEGQWLPTAREISEGTIHLGLRKEVIIILTIAAGIFLLLMETAAKHYSWR